mmetsp:Transcript_13424/g.47764  ORF Transcript_13424/g.47764 Transcript_13424/m.47764 type:complete len:211 (-) Transcript_13424:657-1289(-)
MTGASFATRTARECGAAASPAAGAVYAAATLPSPSLSAFVDKSSAPRSVRAPPSEATPAAAVVLAVARRLRVAVQRNLKPRRSPSPSSASSADRSLSSRGGGAAARSPAAAAGRSQTGSSSLAAARPSGDASRSACTSSDDRSRGCATRRFTNLVSDSMRSRTKSCDVLFVHLLGESKGGTTTPGEARRRRSWHQTKSENRRWTRISCRE